LDDAEVDVPGAAPDAQRRAAWLEERGLAPEDWTDSYGLLEPEETVIIRPYGGEDDDILLNELRPRFVVLYEPNLAFIRRLEVSFMVHDLLKRRGS
jgi:DNA excision repair protein ERCC-4